MSGLDFQGLGGSGKLVNVMPWVEEEPELSNEAVILDVLCATQTGDTLYALPTEFEIRAFVSENGDYPLSDTPMSWEAFFEETKDYERSGLVTDTTDLDIFMERFCAREEAFINEAGGIEALDSPGMAALLEQSRQWSKEGLCASYGEDAPEDAPLYSTFTMTIGWLANVLFQSPRMSNLPVEGYCYLRPSDDETDLIGSNVVLDELFAINAASGKQGASWEFIKYLLGNYSRFFIDVEMPVNRHAFLTSVVTESTIGNPNLDEELARSGVEDFMSRINGAFYEKPVYGIVRDAAAGFYSGEYTAEQAAKIMSENVSAYFSN